MKRVYYAGWMGYQNLGDDLLWELFKENFDRYFDKGEYQLIPENFSRPIEISEGDTFVLGGGSLLNQYIINLMHTWIKMNIDIIFWGTGIDWIPKSHIDFLTEEETRNPEISELFSPETQANLVKVVNHAKYVGVRGPLTYEYIKRMGVNDAKIEICGDPGLILEPTGSQANNEIWLNSDKPIIGVNWGTSNNNIYGGDEVKVENQLVSAIKTLIKMNYQIYLFMVWDKDEEACVRLFNKIGDEENVFLDSKLYNKNQMLELIKNFYFTINFKLHANIVSHVAERPFIPLGYRFKVFDYAKSVDMDRYLISTDATDIDIKILNHESDIRTEYKTIVEKLKTYRDSYKTMVINTFEKQLFLKNNLHGGPIES